MGNIHLYPFISIQHPFRNGIEKIGPALVAPCYNFILAILECSAGKETTATTLAQGV
jgi:hypothetical protein